MSHIALQNQGIVEVGTDLWRHLVQPPCLKQVNKIRFIKILSNWILNTTRNGVSTTSLSSLLQCLTTTKEVLVYFKFKWIFWYLILFPLCLLHLLCTSEENPSLFSFFLLFRYLYTLIWWADPMSCQVLTKPLHHSPPQLSRRDKDIVKGSWAEIRTRRDNTPVTIMG